LQPTKQQQQQQQHNNNNTEKNVFKTRIHILGTFFYSIKVATICTLAFGVAG